jgi:hypothetical protein
MKITITPVDGKWDIVVTRSDGKDYTVTKDTQVGVVKFLMSFLEVEAETVFRMAE